MDIRRIAIAGGTGALGKALALRAARSGFAVMIGSRSSEKAADAAAEIAEATRSRDISAGDNLEAAASGDMVVLTVPFSSQAETLHAIGPAVRGKIVVDTTVPLVPPKVARVQLPEAGSAAAIAAGVLGPQVRLVTAFHNVSAQKLGSEGPVECDVLVFGDDVEARDSVVGIVSRLGLRGIHGGPLANSAAAEALTSVLISINRRYKIAEGAGIRITGLDEDVAAE